MVLTKEVNLPSHSSLTVPEVNLSMSTLMTAAPYVGKACEALNNEFMLCRLENNDPRPCIDLGKRVTACSLELFKKIKKECLSEFNQYRNCLDKSSGDFKLCPCRKTQAVFDQCMSDKLKLDRPDYGHFCRARVHSSSKASPKAVPCPCEPTVRDPTPSLPDCKPKYPARFCGRCYWMTE